jgi:hypothetical protein
MAKTVTTIQNLSDVEKKVIFRDRIEKLLPYNTREVHPLLAAKFFEVFPHDVVEYSPAKMPQPEPGEDIIWVANMTGNPFVPATVTLKRIKDGQEIDYVVPNPLRKASPLRQMMGVGQKWQKNIKTGEEECLNLPKIEIVLPAYQRLRVGRQMADWLLRRDGAQERHHVGKIMVCRGPSYFEPNESWDLDDIRLYAEWIDTQTFVRNHPEHGDVLGPAKFELPNEEAIHDAKVDLLHKLFFKLVDQRYGLLTETEFDTVRGKRDAPQKTERSQKGGLNKSQLASLEAS